MKAAKKILAVVMAILMNLTVLTPMFSILVSAASTIPDLNSDDWVPLSLITSYYNYDSLGSQEDWDIYAVEDLPLQYYKTTVGSEAMTLMYLGLESISPEVSIIPDITISDASVVTGTTVSVVIDDPDVPYWFGVRYMAHKPGEVDVTVTYVIHTEVSPGWSEIPDQLETQTLHITVLESDVNLEIEMNEYFVEWKYPDSYSLKDFSKDIADMFFEVPGMIGKSMDILGKIKDAVGSFNVPLVTEPGEVKLTVNIINPTDQPITPHTVTIELPPGFSFVPAMTNPESSLRKKTFTVKDYIYDPVVLSGGTLPFTIEVYPEYWTTGDASRGGKISASCVYTVGIDLVNEKDTGDYTSDDEIIVYKHEFDSALAKKHTFRASDFECPVNINIYDLNNNLLAAIATDDETVVELDGLFAWAEGDKKYVFTQDDYTSQYVIQVEAVDDGAMSIISCAGELGEPDSVVMTAFEDVPLTRGMVFDTEISADGTLKLFVLENSQRASEVKLSYTQDGEPEDKLSYTQDGESEDNPQTEQTPEPVQNVGGNSKSDSKPVNPVIYIGGGIALFCIIAALVFFIISRKKKNTKK